MHSPLFAHAFEQALREYGYLQGENIAIQYHFLEGEGQLDDAASQMAGLPVDVFVTSSTPTTLAAKHATSKIPIIFTLVGDPVGTGLVTGLARPGGNVTGLSNIGTYLAAKRLQLLKETIPGLSRVAVLARAANPNVALELAETTRAAEAMGLGLQFLDLRSPDEFDSSFQAASLQNAEAITILGDVVITNYVPRLAELALEYRLPAMYTGRPFPAAGGLMAYGPNTTQQFRRAAYYVDRILKGAKPADLPVEQPMTFDFVVNLKTAQALGMTFPPEILLQVTEVIQ